MADENMTSVETVETNIDETLETGTNENTEDVADTENTESTNENTETTENETQNNDEFDPDNLEFEEQEADYKFGDYDLSKFKDNLNLSNDDVRNGFMTLSAELKEQGFTQSQIEWLMQKEIDAVSNKQKETVPTKEQILEDLKNNLTMQEKRDYKVVANFLKESIKGTELEKYHKEAMANPVVYKFIHALYSKNLSGKPLTAGATKENKETKTTGMTIEEAVSGYADYIKEHLGDGEDRTPVINKYLKGLSKEQQKKFKEQFGLK